LIITGLFFYLVWLRDVFSNISNPTEYQQLIETGLFVNPVHVIDLAIFLPALIVVGANLLKKKAVGYFFAAPLLVSLIILSVNISSISILFKFRGLSNSFGIMPVMLFLATIDFIVLSKYQKQLPTKLKR
jgi:hypothetical protein